MTSRLIKLEDMKRMPWKNGRGMTTEIAISPADSSLSESVGENIGENIGKNINDRRLLWRISCAEVEESGPFSIFPGYSRALTVWKGSGLKLNGRDLHPFNIHFFEGEDAIECEPLSPRVFDLGVIFKRGAVDVSIKEFAVASDETLMIQNEASTHFIFCASGEIDADGFHLSEGEVLRIDDSLAYEIRTTAPEAKAAGFVITIREL